MTNHIPTDLSSKTLEDIRRCKGALLRVQVGQASRAENVFYVHADTAIEAHALSKTLAGDKSHIISTINLSNRQVRKELIGRDYSALYVASTNGKAVNIAPNKITKNRVTHSLFTPQDIKNARRPVTMKPGKLRYGFHV